MKFHHFFLFFILSLMAITIPCFGGGCHTLFNSKCESDYKIIIAPGCSECVHYAAQELQYWIEQVSKVKIPIEEGLNYGKRSKRLIVGYNEITRKKIKNSKEPDGINDSFTYCSSEGDIFFWGETDRGTLYSVYSFLEKELGCRWYNSRVSVTPKLDLWSFDKLYNREVPAIKMRNIFYYDIINHPEFAAKARSNSCLFGSIPQKFGGSQDYLGGHTLPHFVSADEYYDEHPEYFSEINGKRIREKAQLCLSNPDVLKLVIQKVRETIKNNPNHLIYSVSQGDYENPCQCEKCRAIKKQYGNEESGILLWFVNQVADAVKEEFPNKYIGTFAYWYSRHVPKNIVPRDNVVIRLCSIEVCQLHKLDGCKTNKAFLDDLSGWASIAPRVYIWDYSTIFTNYALPLPNIPTLQDKMRRYRDSGAIGIMSQGSYQSVINGFEDLKAYILSKLQWNPESDVEAIVKDFTDGYFGPAAGPIIREYLSYESSALVSDDNFGSIFSNEDVTMYTDEFVKKGQEFFKRAKAAVNNSEEENKEEYINRLEYAQIGLCLLETLRDPKLGRSNGSLDLIKRVVKREGITHLREFQAHRTADEYIKYLETK